MKMGFFEVNITTLAENNMSADYKGDIFIWVCTSAFKSGDSNWLFPPFSFLSTFIKI